MTPRQEAFYYVSIAWSFAYNCVKQGLKYKRTLTCTSVVMDTLAMKLTNKQKKDVYKRIEEMMSDTVNVYDFMDWVKQAMEIIANGKERWLNSCLALAVTNVPEEVEDG